MAQLLFREEFVDAIQRGRKTTTLRRWKSRRVKAGTLAFAPNVGWLRITACDTVRLADLCEADARADGFSSLDQLLRTLAEIYPEPGDDGRAWYRITFEFDRPAPPKARSAESSRKRKQPRRRARKALARRIRDELDKVVEQKGSLFPL
jgi:hypothetical protein